MTASHSPLTAAEVIAQGGWHPRYARVIALAGDDGYGFGFALVDGNGDESEPEAEAWNRWGGHLGTGVPLRRRPARRRPADQGWRPDQRDRLVRLRQRPRDTV